MHGAALTPGMAVMSLLLLAAAGAGNSAGASSPGPLAPSGLPWAAAIGGGLALLGGVMIFLGVRRIEADQWLRRNGIRVPGVVTRIEVVDGEEHNTYYPVLRFWTADRRDVETRSRTACTRRGASPGQPVTVRYDPRNPAKADTDDLPSRGAGPGLAVAVGTMFLLGGLLVLTIGLTI